MPQPTPPTVPTNSTMAERQAARLAVEAARIAAGLPAQEQGRVYGFRAGIDAENPLIVVRHVSS